MGDNLGKMVVTQEGCVPLVFEASEFKTTIAVRRWRIVPIGGLKDRYGVDGDCDPPTAKNKAIRFDTDLGVPDTIETIIHEMTHASFPTVDEEVVRQFGRDVRRVLLRVLRDLGTDLGE